MLTQSSIPVIAVVVVSAIIVAGLVGYAFVSTSSNLASLSRQNTDLSQQVSNLNQQIGDQNGQLSSLNQQIGNQNQQIGSLDEQVSTLEQRTQTVITVQDTIVTMQTTTLLLTTTQTSIGEIPQSALVVTGSSYDNQSSTFTFLVQNTENYTVYAQLSASFYGAACNFYAGEGTYLSQVYTFAQTSSITITMDLKAANLYASQYCGQEPVISVSLNFEASSSVVSPTYQFQIVPGYQL